MLKRLWADHRWACLLSLALLVIGVVVSPWVLLAAVLPVGWVLLNNQPAAEDQPLEIQEVTELMKELPKEWQDLGLEKIVSEMKEALVKTIEVNKGLWIEECVPQLEVESYERDDLLINLSEDDDEGCQEYQFDFNRFEGSYDGTIYVWVEEYLRYRDLYDDLVEAGEDIIEFLQHEAIFTIGITANKMKIDSKVVKYFTDYGMDNYIQKLGAYPLENTSQEVLGTSRYHQDFTIYKLYTLDVGCKIDSKGVADKDRLGDWFLPWAEGRINIGLGKKTNKQKLMFIQFAEFEPLFIEGTMLSFNELKRYIDTNKKYLERIKAKRGLDPDLIVRLIITSIKRNIYLGKEETMNKGTISFEGNYSDYLGEHFPCIYISVDEYQDIQDLQYKDGCFVFSKTPFEHGEIKCPNDPEDYSSYWHGDMFGLKFNYFKFYTNIFGITCSNKYAKSLPLYFECNQDKIDHVQDYSNEKFDLDEDLFCEGNYEYFIEELRLGNPVKAEMLETLLNELLDDNCEPEVLEYIILNPHTSAGILDKIRDNEEWPDDLKTIIKDSFSFRELPEEWKRLDDDEKVERLNTDKNIDENIIKILSKSSNWEIRQAIAQNQSTPEDILKILLDDHDDDVQEATKKALKERDIPYESSYDDD